MTRLASRNLLCLSVSRSLSLIDLRPHATSWPVLQSLRFRATQALAADIRAKGYDGIVYRSAQHYGQDCFTLFGSALAGMKQAWRQPLVDVPSGRLHRVAAAAVVGSQITLVE